MVSSIALDKEVKSFFEKNGDIEKNVKYLLIEDDNSNAIKLFERMFSVKKLTFSIIGCEHSHISTFIGEMLEQGHSCAGIYEAKNKQLLHELAEKFQLKIVDEMESLLGPEVSVIGCAAINNEKIAVIELCEKHGKHIMVDKPIVTNKEDFTRVQNVINRGKIQIGMLFTERFRPALNTVKEKITQGDIGEIVSIEMRKPHRLKPDERPGWHFSKQQGGGIVVDLFIHDFDLLRWLTAQDVTDLSGYVSKNILPEYPDFYDVASLQVLTEDGVIATLYADWHTPEKSWTWGDCRIFIVGTKGTFELRLSGDPFIHQDELVIRITHDEEVSEVKLNEVPTSITEDFLNRINGKDAIIQHQDILAATKATLDADDVVRVINNLA